MAADWDFSVHQITLINAEIADELVLNLIHFNSKVSGGSNEGDKYKSTQVGANYAVAPGMFVGFAHVRFDGDSKSGADSDGSSNRLQFRVNF